jgi:outer membrane protein assembly factor BamB
MRFRWLCGSLLLALAGCDDGWMQFHGGASNSGFYLADTDFAFRPRWSAEVGQVVYSSPAVGEDGTIYVGNMDGELVAVAPDGTERWRRLFPDSVILASPAVAPDGNIYVIVNHEVDEDTIVSQLQKVEPDGDWAWTFTYTGGLTTSSPKVWQFEQAVHILTQVEGVNTQLVIVDGSGDLVHEEVVAGCAQEIVGDGWSPFEAISDFLSILLDFPVEFDPASLPSDIPDQFGWLTPTVAIVGEPGDGEIGVAVAGSCEITVLRWSPPDLEHVWTEQYEEDDSPRNLSSPAVFVNGLLVIGGEEYDHWWRPSFHHGRVWAFDAETGAQLWKFDTPDPVMATPASFGRQIFVASLHDFHVLDSDGDLLDTLPLGDEQTAASAALSRDLGYFSSTGGLTSFEFDLANVLEHRATPGPLSSPVIAEDGTVYAISGTRLFAFPR